MPATIYDPLGGPFASGLAPIGGSGSAGAIPAVANVNVTPVGTGNDVAETDLMTYTLPANALSANGRGVRITAWGTTLAAANAQTIKLKFGATTTTTISMAMGTQAWCIRGEILRTGAATQIGNTLWGVGVSAFGTPACSPGENTANPIIIKVTGQNGVATVNGVQQTGFIVEMIN